jgi:hypothetical protein
VAQGGAEGLRLRGAHAAAAIPRQAAAHLRCQGRQDVQDHVPLRRRLTSPYACLATVRVHAEEKLLVRVSFTVALMMFCSFCSLRWLVSTHCGRVCLIYEWFAIYYLDVHLRQFSNDAK